MAFKPGFMLLLVAGQCYRSHQMATIKVPEIANPGEVARPRKYRDLLHCFSDLQHDYLFKGLCQKELRVKYNKLCSKRFSAASLATMLSATKSGHARKRIAGATGAAMNQIHSPKAMIARSTEIAVERIVERQAKGKVRHFDRMERHLDKASDVLEKTRPTKKAVGQFLQSVDTLDKVARRIYAIDDDKPLDAQKLSIALLVSVGEADLTAAPSVATERAVN